MKPQSTFETTTSTSHRLPKDLTSQQKAGVLLINNWKKSQKYFSQLLLSLGPGTNITTLSKVLNFKLTIYFVY